MPKNKSRHNGTSDTKEARLIAAQSFVKGDRVRHKITGKIGQFDSINLGFALPEVWVQFETDTEIRVPISCNPLELELIERCNDSTQFSVAVAASESAACATEELKEQNLSTSSMSPSSLSCIPNNERAELDITHTSFVTTTLEPSFVTPESSMSSAVELHTRESVELTPTAKDEIWSAPASAITCSDSSTTLDIPDGWTDILSPDGGQLTLPLLTSASTNVVSPIAQSDLYPKETPFHPNNQQSCGDESDISPDGFRPGMRVWSERRITTLGKPEQVIRMAGVVVRTTSRLIVSDQTSDVPVDTPLVEVQWDGVKSIVLLSPGELHREASSDQARSDTPTHCDQEAVVPEVVEELTEEEAADRHRLELKVEKAFYEAGAGLRELRDKRLYRSTHKNFEDYCRDRFGMERRHPYRLIEAALVVDNLSSCVQIGHILPTNEAQCRELAKLPAEQQPAAWLESVKRSPEKRVPPASTVKGVVQEIKQRDNTPAPISYSEGDVVEIRAGVNPNLRKHDGCWGVVTHVGTWNCTVHISVRNVDVQCKADEMDKVDPKYTADIRVVSERIAVLSNLDLDPVIWSILETLSRQSCFTQIQLNSLAWAEQQYGISTTE